MQLICNFVLTYAKSRVSHDAVQISHGRIHTSISFFRKANSCLASVIAYGPQVQVGEGSGSVVEHRTPE